MDTNDFLESILKQVLKFFKDHKDQVLEPSDITEGVYLYRGLNEKTIKRWGFIGSHNDKLAQGFINELLNREEIIRVEAPLRTREEDVQWIGYQYKNNNVIKIKTNTNDFLELILNQIFDFFKDHKDKVLEPSDITKEFCLYKSLNEKTIKQWKFTGTHKDKIAQGFINELLNREKIVRIKSTQRRRDGKFRWLGYQYKSNFVIRRK